MSAHLCDACEGETIYQVLSGGKEWYCPHCGNSGEYAEGEAPRRVEMLRTSEGRRALCAEMREELTARKKES